MLKGISRSGLVRSNTPSRPSATKSPAPRKMISGGRLKSEYKLMRKQTGGSKRYRNPRKAPRPMVSPRPDPDECSGTCALVNNDTDEIVGITWCELGSSHPQAPIECGCHNIPSTGHHIVNNCVVG